MILKNKRLFALLTALLLFTTMLPGFATADAESGHEPITIMNAQRDYTKLIDLVHEKYPEINIEIVPYRGRNMSAYVAQQLETGIMPDIYSTTRAWDPSYQEAHLIDLSQYAVAEQYSPARLEELTYNGGLYLLPFDYSVSGILCNQSLLDRSGIEVPTSFAQMRDETIPALKEKGIDVSVCLMDLPASAFQFFFGVAGTMYTNTLKGRAWRSSFTDITSDTFAADNADFMACIDYYQEWIDCGLINYTEESALYTDTWEKFQAGNTAFLIGTVNRFTQYDDGTGDQYILIPYLSEDGTTNSYTTSPGRLYGLNKELEQPGNEQKLEDALHVLEVLSTNEGYIAIHGENSTNMCSIADFIISDDSPFAKPVEMVSKGFSQDLIYVGWENYLVPFGEALCEWVKGNSDGTTAVGVLDDTKRQVQQSGETIYATVTEELDTVQAAQLSGQMFMAATGADCALISYNVYNPEIHANFENSYGANGHILPGEMDEEDITIFLPGGWYDTLLTGEFTGSEIKVMAAAGADTRGTGFRYPYVFLTADGNALDDDTTYTVVFGGVDKDMQEEYGITDTGIVGLDAAKEYLLKVGEVSSATPDDSLVQTVE